MADIIDGKRFAAALREDVAQQVARLKNTHGIVPGLATVTIAHSRTRDLSRECRRADILVAAVGRPQMVKGDWIKPGAVVIDVGINRMFGNDRKSRLIGDVDFEGACQAAGAITPVPGGVGPMTMACLLFNTLTAAFRQQGIPISTAAPGNAQGLFRQGLIASVLG